MRAVVAILVDAYRELSSRKIFWITLALSVVLVVSYASIGFTETGMSLLFGLHSFDSDYFHAGSPLASVLYKGIFSYFIVGMWLAWAATILALISTASIFPDLVARGSIDLVLSKPVSRVTIFGAKYLAGMLFATLQVSIVCLGVFLALGWRIGEWNWMIFAALPIVVVFFSYLFCISACVGIVSRSSITALLLAILFWFSLFSVQAAESILHRIKLQYIVNVEHHEAAAEEAQSQLAALEEDEAATDYARNQMRTRIEIEQDLADQQRLVVNRLEPWHRGIEMLLLPLPKTGQTIGLLNRWLVDEDDVSIPDLFTGNFRYDDQGEIIAYHEPETEAQRRLQETYDERSLWYVLGTSLLFECFMLVFAAWIFSRRDF